jgi:hypothetical protein
MKGGLTGSHHACPLYLPSGPYYYGGYGHYGDSACRSGTCYRAGERLTLINPSSVAGGYPAFGERR